MKKVIAILLISIYPLIAESLTVLNNRENSKVFLNGVSIGRGDISNFEIEPGEYVLSIKVNNNVTYKETVVIGVGDKQVVDTNEFVGIKKGTSSVIDYGAKQIEEQRLRKATRGYIGFGGFLEALDQALALRSTPLIDWQCKSQDGRQKQVARTTQTCVTDFFTNLKKRCFRKIVCPLFTLGLVALINQINLMKAQ